MINWIKDQYASLSNDEQAFVRLVLGVIAVLLFIVVLANNQANAATYTATDSGGNTLTVTEQKCPIPSKWFKDWFSGVMVYKGRMLKVCWRLGRSQVMVIDSDGDFLAVPTKAFRKDVGT